MAVNKGVDLQLARSLPLPPPPHVRRADILRVSLSPVLRLYPLKNIDPGPWHEYIHVEPLRC